MGKTYAEYGIAVGDPDDRCEYVKCRKHGKVDKGDRMVEEGIMGRRFHVACWRKYKKEHSR